MALEQQHLEHHLQPGAVFQGLDMALEQHPEHMELVAPYLCCFSGLDMALEQHPEHMDCFQGLDMALEQHPEHLELTCCTLPVLFFRAGHGP